MDKKYRVQVAFKTVRTFGGITRRKLYLLHAQQPSNDGYAIKAPFQSDNFYQIVEHEISHILFGTDPLALRGFIHEYTLRAKRAVNSIPLPALSRFLADIANILEDHRVISLWGLLYPGSQRRIAEMFRQNAGTTLPYPLKDPVACLLAISRGLEVESTIPEDRLVLFKEALRKVERRGYNATLLVTAWLVKHLVDEDVESGADPDNTDARVQALEEILAGSRGLPKLLKQELDSNKGSPREGSFAYEKSHSMGARTAKIDIRGEGLQDLLDQSSSEMDHVMARARVMLRQPIPRDEWLARSASAPVDFKDRKQATSQPLSPEDIAIINRLRSFFMRILGRKKFALSDTGTEVDVPALVQAKVTGSTGDCFVRPVRGRGFRTLILADLSGSMAGSKIEQVERACRILRRALDFPFVDIEIWGFCSVQKGVVRITRFDTRTLDPSLVSQVYGETPIHVATHVAARHLQHSSKNQHLLILTDGSPVYRNRSGQRYNFNTLVKYTREAVDRSRKAGVHTTALLIGENTDTGTPHYDISNDFMKSMFGHRQFWSRIAPDSLGHSLLETVQKSFTRYLRSL